MIPAFIILFLVAALIVTCTTFQNLIQFFPSRGMTYLMTLHAIISLSVCICFFLCIKRLIDVFSLNLEQERNILASLYQEKEKREIINNDEKEINKVKELVDIAKENKIPVIFLTNTIPYAINITNITKRFYEYADVEIDLESSDCKEKTYVTNIVALGADTIKIL